MKIGSKTITGVLLSGAVAMVVYIGVKAQNVISKDVEQGNLYNSLREKVNKLSDKDLDGRVSLDEAKTVLSSSYTNAVDIEGILMNSGYNPNIGEMQNYLKSEGKFDEKTDDLNNIGYRKNFRYALRGITL